MKHWHTHARNPSSLTASGTEQTNNHSPDPHHLPDGGGSATFGYDYSSVSVHVACGFGVTLDTGLALEKEHFTERTVGAKC